MKIYYAYPHVSPKYSLLKKERIKVIEGIDLSKDDVLIKAKV